MSACVLENCDGPFVTISWHVISQKNIRIMLVNLPATSSLWTQWAGKDTFLYEESKVISGDIDILILSFSWAEEKQRSTAKNQTLPTHWQPPSTQHRLPAMTHNSCQKTTTLETLDSLSGTSCHTHRWCRLCWCCALWLAPGRCPADRDAPGRCQPCWHPAAGVGWKSPAVSSPLSSVWCEMGLQRNVVSGVRLVMKTLLPTPPASTNELNTSNWESVFLSKWWRRTRLLV